MPLDKNMSHEEFIKYVNELEKVTIEVTENGDYNSFKVVYIENKK